MHAPVGGEVDLGPAARARKPDMSKAALFLEPGPALIIQCALMREQAFLPAGQEDGIEFKTLGGVQRHDRYGFALALVGVQHQRDVLEEACKILEFLHGANELLEVFQAAGSISAAILLPHLGVA